VSYNFFITWVAARRHGYGTGGKIAPTTPHHSQITFSHHCLPPVRGPLFFVYFACFAGKESEKGQEQSAERLREPPGGILEHRERIPKDPEQNLRDPKKLPGHCERFPEPLEKLRSRPYRNIWSAVF